MLYEGGHCGQHPLPHRYIGRYVSSDLCGHESWGVYNAGGSDDGDYSDEILQFHPDTEEWSLAGRMMETRWDHAVSTINFEDVRDHCIL